MAARLHAVAIARDPDRSGFAGLSADARYAEPTGAPRPTSRDRGADAISDAAKEHRALPVQFAATETSQRLGQPAPTTAQPTADFDRRLVRNSFATMIADPRAAMEYLYARLFVAHPQLRTLFPLAMTQTRAATFRMLARLIWSLDNPQATRDILGQLARDHRKFGVKPGHYQPFFDALLATAEQATGPDWTAETGAAWRSALDYFAAVMTAAAELDAKQQPAWWTAEVVQHDRRTETIAVVTVRPDKPLSYRPGQYIAVQSPRWPRVWRTYSIANAPRENGLLDIHVRAISGGMVSTTLVSHCGTGDMLTLGGARGGMRVIQGVDRDLVCVAGGTGLAPLKAITEAIVEASGHGRRRGVTLYLGVRSSHDLYDMRDLETLRRAYPSLTLIPVVENELTFAGRVGRLPEVVATHHSFRGCDVYVAGPAAMVSATVRALSGRVPSDLLHHDPLDALRKARHPPKESHVSH